MMLLTSVGNQLRTSAACLLGHCSISLTGIYWAGPKRHARRDTPIPPSSVSEPSSFFSKAKQRIKAQDMLTLICKILKILNLLGTLTLAGLTVLTLLTLTTDGQEHPNEAEEWIGYHSIVHSWSYEQCRCSHSEHARGERQHGPLRSCHLHYPSIEG
jgi:hypothetical protein